MRQSMSALCSWLERGKGKVESPDSCLFFSLFNHSFYWSSFQPLDVYHLCMLYSSAVSLGLGQTRPVCDSVTVFLHFGLSCSIFYFVSWLLTRALPVHFGYWVLNRPLKNSCFKILIPQCWELLQTPKDAIIFVKIESSYMPLLCLYLSCLKFYLVLHCAVCILMFICSSWAVLF